MKSKTPYEKMLSEYEKRLHNLSKQTTAQLQDDYSFWQKRAKDARRKGRQDQAAERNEKLLDRALDERMNSW